MTDLYRGKIRRTPLSDTLARSYLAPLAFQPSYRFTRRVALSPAQLVPWPALDAWVPRRVAWWVNRLAREIAPEQYHPLRVGHRGAAAHAPDNSLEGIEAAARLGAHAVEIDARVTADGALVAAHDAALRAAAGRELPIDLHTLAELRAAAPLATIDEVLARCDALRLGLYLELKDERAALPALRTIVAHGYAGRAIIASFRPAWLAAVRDAASEMPTAVLFGQIDADPIELAASCGASFVHPCWERRAERPDELLTPQWVARVREAGLGIVTWHEERPEVIAGVRRAGVDAICSDRPELLP